jgi:hypothetical protein
MTAPGEAELRQAFDALWARAEAEGVTVQYDLDRIFVPRRHGAHDRNWRELGPRIWLFRDAGQLPKPSSDGRYFRPDYANVAEELATLGHEYGHQESFRRHGHTREWQEYERAAMRHMNGDALSLDDKRLILEEEERAWSIARDVLRELGIHDWPYLDERCERGLAVYRERLSGQEAEP